MTELPLPSMSMTEFEKCKVFLPQEQKKSDQSQDGYESSENKYEKKSNRKPNLLHWKDMPKHLQFNPHILTGYRPLSDAWGCISSMWQLHNETINIVTHAVPILYILLTVPQILPWSQAKLSFLAWCHIAGILCPWIGSFIYHLFMNLQRGPKTYYFLLQVDMLGIWVSQSFGAMPMLFATTHCLPDFIRTSIITCYCFFSIWGLYKALTAWSPWERRLCFSLPFMMRALLWFLRASSVGGGDPAAFLHVILQDVVSILGGAIGALHIPEKWFPGSVDMYLNSHNIMHVLVVAAVYSMHIATMRDLQWMSKTTCNTGLLIFPLDIPSYSSLNQSFIIRSCLPLVLEK